MRDHTVEGTITSLGLSLQLTITAKGGECWSMSPRLSVHVTVWFVCVCVGGGGEEVVIIYMGEDEEYENLPCCFVQRQAWGSRANTPLLWQ